MDLVSDNEDIVTTGAGEVEQETALGNTEEESVTAHDGSPEQTTMAPSPPPSA